MKVSELLTYDVQEGDWFCPSCGVLSFSWREECYNCHTIRPQNSKEIITKRMNHLLNKSIHKKIKKKNKKLSDKNVVVVDDKDEDEKEKMRNELVIDSIINKKKIRKSQEKGSNVNNNNNILKELLHLSIKSNNYDKILSLTNDIMLSTKHQFIPNNIIATMINVYGKSKNFDLAMNLFNQFGINKKMRKRPTMYHYSSIINACTDNKKWEEALRILNDMRNMKYSNDKKLKYRELPNVVIYSTVMNCCCKSKRYDKSLQVFELLLSEFNNGTTPPKDTILFNQALYSCLKMKKYKRAYELYTLMYDNKIKKDQVTYGTMLSICDQAGDWVLANEIIKEVNKRVAIDMNIPMYSSAIGAFTKGGQYDKALELFDDVKKRNDLILDSAIYSKILYTLTSQCKDYYNVENCVNEQEDVEVDKKEDGDKDKKISLHNGQRSLLLLAEMAKRNLLISAYHLVQVIEVLDCEEMYQEAVNLYQKGENNKVFPGCVSLVNGKQRRVDLRHNSAAMCKVKIWSLLEKLLDSNDNKNKDIHDILLILGNNNKHLMDVIIDCLKNNLHSSNKHPNPIRYVVQEDGTVLKIPKSVIMKWIKLAGKQ